MNKSEYDSVIILQIRGFSDSDSGKNAFINLGNMDLLNEALNCSSRFELYLNRSYPEFNDFMKICKKIINRQEKERRQSEKEARRRQYEKLKKEFGGK